MRFSRSSSMPTSKSAGLPASVGLLVVLGEGDGEGLVVALAQADQVVLEAGNEALAADDQRHPLSRGALDRLAVARAEKRITA